MNGTDTIGTKAICLDKNEILRYLGHKGQPVDMDTMKAVDDGITDLVKAAKFRYTYKIFDIQKVNTPNGAYMELANSRVRLLGNDICEHLRDCEKCALLAATLGIEVDNLIRVAQNTDMLRAVVLDACGTDFIEKVGDLAEQEIREQAAAEGFGITFRFSPGYGDLPLETQESLIAALDAGRKIGLTLTDTSLMIPGKSVTAIIGFTCDKSASRKPTGCDICSMREECEFRKAGASCGRG